MANITFPIKSEKGLSRFHTALNLAGSVAEEMVSVKTKILHNQVVKVVDTECPQAMAIFRSFAKVGVVK